MRKLVVLTALAFVACTATPAPATVTEQLARLRVTHPVAWTSVAGPGPVAGGGLVPEFYLTNTTLTVTCPPPPSGGLFEGCPAPITTLPAGGVLVTVSNAGNLGEPLPPEVNAGSPTDDWTGPCRSIGGERQVVSTLDGVVVSACLRGPNLDAAEDAVRAMIASLALAG
ncbi:MAG: hypothetical protein ACHQ01_05200 [Candidatus Limnocylindrales bacterium]